MCLICFSINGSKLIQRVRFLLRLLIAENRWVRSEEEVALSAFVGLDSETVDLVEKCKLGLYCFSTLDIMLVRVIL